MNLILSKQQKKVRASETVLHPATNRPTIGERVGSLRGWNTSIIVSSSSRPLLVLITVEVLVRV